MKQLVFLYLTFCMISCAAEFRPPVDAVCSAPRNENGRTWSQCGTIELTYAAARKTFDLSLRRQGWTKLKTIDFDLIQWKTLEIWEKDGKRILMQFWREDVSRTGFAWGPLKEEAKS